MLKYQNRKTILKLLKAQLLLLLSISLGSCSLRKEEEIVLRDNYCSLFVKFPQPDDKDVIAYWMKIEDKIKNKGAVTGEEKFFVSVIENIGTNNMVYIRRCHNK